MRADVFVMDGCHYCEDLMSRLRNAGIPFTAYYSDDNGCGFRATPGTYIWADGGGGNCYGYPTCDVDCQFAAIRAAYSPATAPATPITTPTPAPKPPAPAGAASDKPTVWAGEVLTIKWGGVSGTVGKTYEELMLEATNPIPPDEPVGLTVALRETKKAPTSKKIT